MQTHLFDPVASRLAKGVNLIEASAGTGKTYAIAMLVLRFIVEHGLTLDQLLVVTFTKAATEELKTRVRERLADAKRATMGVTEGVDNNILSWLSTLTMEAEMIRQRLSLALLNIDSAAIFTIHGFCQRVLKEHALESGQLFDTELSGDLTLIKQACADDFWRRQISWRPLWDIAVLTADYTTPDALLASIDLISPNVPVFPEADNLDVKLSALKKCADQAKTVLEEAYNILAAGIADEKFKSGYTVSFEFRYRQLHQWLHGLSNDMPAADSLSLFTQAGLWAALNGHKFRATKTQSGDTRKILYLLELGVQTEPFDALEHALRDAQITLRRNLLETLRIETTKRLQQQNMLSFDNLITCLSDAIHGDNGGLLTFELQQRYHAVLIDEFQDTDQTQWHIFSSLFAVPSHYLYLIGDPKQAIYKFRGADIYAYLSAQAQAEHRYTLGRNWRSHPNLVNAVNVLFQRKRAFLIDRVDYHTVAPAKSKEQGELQIHGKALAPMMIWQLPETENKNGYWTAGKAAEEIKIAVVNETVSILNEPYHLVPSQKRLNPGDIAILVRTNTQAREYQVTLLEAGIPAVINSTDSVFKSHDAIDLFTLLQSIASPGDILLLKRALSLDWFGLDGQALYRLVNNENLLDSWLSRFTGYHEIWQRYGLMSMMQEFLEQERIRQQLSKSLAAERRITNLHHLIEWAQQAAVEDHLGIMKTLDRLHSKIVEAKQDIGCTEDTQLRLESDENAVHVITMHRAKGLEFPIVFCPCLWQRSGRLFREKLLVRCHEDGQMIADLGSVQFEERRNHALTEELAEDLRVLYVALTRAKFRCYLVWADARSENTPNASALSWLLEFAETDFTGQQKKLIDLCLSFPDTFSFKALPISNAINANYHKPPAMQPLKAKTRKRTLFSFWQMSSYTALSALRLEETPEIPADKADEFQTGTVELSPLLLPRGPHTGNVVHELLENNAFADLAQRKSIAIRRDQACRRYGLTLESPQVIDELLQAVVETPLSETDNAFCLKHIDDNLCLKEMPFYLSMQTMDVGIINGILQDTPAFIPLTSKQISGFLTGFIDLICRYKGRFYVMDYKTNALRDYDQNTLTEAMREHNYGLQYWLYTVVMHRYLQQRLPDYSFNSHFGGVRYLFVRGMKPQIPMSGVFQDSPDYAKVIALSKLFESN